MARTSRFRSLVALTVAATGLLGSTPAPSRAMTALQIDYMYCLSTGHGRAECQSSVSGGTGSYTYTWNPRPYAGPQGHVLIYCTAYSYKTVTLTVTDSSGATSTVQNTFYCGDAV